MKLALCVLGCGQFAQTFVRGIHPLRDEVDLYFASRDLPRARAYAGKFQGCGAFGSYAEAVADPRIDAVYVCTPHYLHREHVVLAAAAGKHVLVEKPIAATLEDAQEMVAAAERAGVTLMVAENYRFMSAVRRCKGLVDAGAFGQLRLVQLQEEAPFAPAQWRSDPVRNGGGVFIDGGIHKVSLLRYLAGDPAHVFAARLPQALPEHQAEDGLVAALRWDNGMVGFINHSWTVSHSPPPGWVSLSGTRATAYFELGAPWLRLEQAGSQEVLALEDDCYGLLPMAREFLDCIREGREPEMPGIEGVRDVAVVLKAYQSALEGVSLPYRASSLGESSGLGAD